MRFLITSPAFDADREIPQRYSCDDKEISPPLQWAGVPEGSLSLALIMDDPDAPDPAAPKMTWVHWVLYNLRADSGGIPEAVQDSELPAGTLHG
ncbi:MAG: YbhB/YbcL family Raf kinase inhibitor-like protein, partial [Gammaproteobacteria bacterium]|nr:YbhB/YbcL family Raf kinase inhibitor-like protein [Gammaproteobacteria bacterium]